MGQFGAKPRTLILRGEFRPDTLRGWPKSAENEAQVAVSEQQSETRRSALPLVFFVVALFLPWIFSVGSFALSPYRLVVIVMTLPCVAMWIAGRAGPIRLADIIVFAFWAWCFLSLLVLHGVSQSLQPAGILFFETIGPYLLGRCYIRTADDFKQIVSLLFRAIAILLPFAIVETLSGRDILKDIFGMVMSTHIDAKTDPRWGFSRVQSVFEHPILYGVVSGSILALVHLVLGHGKSNIQRFTRTGIVAFTAFLSLSAGPITAIMTQILLLTWNWLAAGWKARWKILWCIVAAIYALIAVVSNQTVPEFYLTHFSFDAQSANFRVLIWTFGTESVLLHPWFGVGLGEWVRPDWMPPSIDMFWLIFAIQHGLPAGMLMMAAFFAVYLPISFKKGLDSKFVQYRTAYIIVMTGFFLVGWTVHFWNATYVLFMFLLGSGMWLLDVKSNPPVPDSGAVK
jgi:O-antigen ligase